MNAPTVMPFGRQRGRPLSEIDTGYLRWVVAECHNLDPNLRAAIREELHRRVAAGPPVGDLPPAGPAGPPRAVAADLRRLQGAHARVLRWAEQHGLRSPVVLGWLWGLLGRERALTATLARGGRPGLFPFFDSRN